jgi:uncharacterized membrane protein YeaQ/YmgE (transglycosylase-associated protein family)
VSIEGFFSAIGVGLVLGVLGRLLVRGRSGMGCLLTIAVGILAALVGGLLAGALGLRNGEDGFSWPVFGIQVLVAAVGVAIVGGVTRRSS